MLIDSRPEGRRANTGGPMSRTRTERLRCTLLGLSRGPIICPLTLCLGLEFSRKDPVDTVYRLLDRSGFRDPEALRASFGQGLGPLACRPNPELQPLVVAGADPQEVLLVAFLLGLCSAVRFDPGRPVLWTRASLTRRLELFEMKEFYA
jgi:hypothetical protein